MTKLRNYIINLNSFEVQARNEEEAIEKAEKLIKAYKDIVYPLEAIEETED